MKCPACGKQAETKPEALQHRNRLIRTMGAARIHVYRCPALKGREAQWHVVHNRSKPRTKR